ncbi:hypothetical protein FOL47_006562 [Perkinsus chesapeaki]|uniref:Uncharacterized protein n=1 Tax=Perkinsus chesapeaki TaxID=330153 RepID=A0A7J6LRE6_PERCH|nr:hypothetical protein FOL47_006562 [Perkinsus chesapeaki]
MVYDTKYFLWGDQGSEQDYKAGLVMAHEKLLELSQLKADLDRLVASVAAVRFIEKYWLEHNQRVKGPLRNRAATRISSWWKSIPSRRVYRKFVEVKRKNAAAVKLQSFWRGRLARKETVYRRELATHSRLIRRVQAHWRGRIARRKVASLRREIAERQAELTAVTFIQAAYRRKSHRRQTLVREILAVKVARVWRQFVRRRKLKQRICAESIQLYWRALKRRQTVKEARKESAVAIQSAWRGNRARRERAKQLDVIVQLQARRRATVARMRVNDIREAAARESRMLQATAFLQALCKGNQQRRKFLTEKMMVIKVQRAWKSFVARRQLEREMAVRIQRAVRRWQQRRRLEKATLVVQSVRRGTLARRESMKHRELILRLQARWRGCVARREVFELKEAILLEGRVINALTFVQAMYKGNRQRRRFLWERMMVMKVQRTWRRFVKRRQLKRKIAIKTIQLFWLGRKVAWKGKEGREKATVVLQTSIRTALCRRRLRELEVECFKQRSAECAARCLPPSHPRSAWANYTMVSRTEGADTVKVLSTDLRYPLNEHGLTRDGVLLNGLDPRTTPFTRVIIKVKRFEAETITIDRMKLATRAIERWWRAIRPKKGHENTSASWLDMIKQYASDEMARRLEFLRESAVDLSRD